MNNEKKERTLYLVYLRSLQVSEGWKKDIKDTFVSSTHAYSKKQAIGWIRKQESEKSNGYREYSSGNEVCYIQKYFIAVEVPQPKPVVVTPIPQPKPVKKEKTTKKSQDNIYQMTLKDYGL